MCLPLISRFVWIPGEYLSNESKYSSIRESDRNYIATSCWCLQRITKKMFTFHKDTKFTPQNYVVLKHNRNLFTKKFLLKPSYNLDENLKMQKVLLIKTFNKVLYWLKSKHFLNCNHKCLLLNLLWYCVTLFNVWRYHPNIKLSL